jgi:hypothetical protein
MKIKSCCINQLFNAIEMRPPLVLSLQCEIEGCNTIWHRTPHDEWEIRGREEEE